MSEHLLICTDLDRTLIPNGPESVSPGSHEHFAKLAAHQKVELAYVSGRHSELIEEAIIEHDLPVPDFVIGTVFCGDSGNDLEVLVSPLQAVLVANALPEIKEQARETAHCSGNRTQLYIARGGCKGMNGNYSAGMLEGIAHYCPHAIEWMGFD